MHAPQSGFLDVPIQMQLNPRFTTIKISYYLQIKVATCYINDQNIFQLILRAGNVRDIALFSAISWNLWRHRNELAHGTSVDNSFSLLRKAEDLVFSFEAANKATEPCNPPLIVDRSLISHEI